MLNALRHQWYFHTQTFAEIIKGEVVLNALRHQWYFHNHRGKGTDIGNWCSTPYGINGIFTIIADINRIASSHPCSTPYGINGIFTGEFPDRNNIVRPCSTPYGINGIFTFSNTNDLSALFIVLNALRHQWYFHSDP